MKRLSRFHAILISLAIVGLITTSIISLSGFAAEPDAELEDLRAEVARLQAENQQLREKAERLEKYNQGWYDWYLSITKLCDEHGIKYEKMGGRAEQRDHVPEPPDPGNDPWSGFRGIKWGTELGSIGRLTFVQNSVGLVWHTRDTDVLKIGAAALSSIQYGFYKGKLHSVLITCDGFENSSALQAAVRATYGNGKQSLLGGVWSSRGGKEPRTVSVIVSENRFAETSSFLMTYGPLEQQKRQDDYDAAKRAVKDF